MPELAIRFASARTAQVMVAGIPAAARAVHAVRQAFRNMGRPEPGEIVLIVPGGWQPGERCRAELERLAPGARISVSDVGDAAALVVYAGEHSQRAADVTLLSRESGPLDERRLLAQLRTSSRRTLAETSKPTDGIVSTWLNRPLSRTISRALLHVPGMSPMFATAVAALLGLLMALSLVIGGSGGLIWGALLFQAASIVDGVDGEIARATFRTSALGAKLDSLTDALTNLAFIAGVSINLYQDGQTAPALAGLAGLVIYAAGFVLLGRSSVRQGAPFTFDALKGRTMFADSLTLRIATYVMMRDFYALASAVLIVLGFASLLLIVLAISVSVWLICVIALVMSPENRQPPGLR